MLFTQLFESDFNKKPVAEAIDDDYEDCSYCSGTGEGRWEGSTCTHCDGSGVEPVSQDDDDFEDPDGDVADMDSDEESYYEKSLRSRGLGEAGVAEAGVGNRMSDMTVGSPKIVHKNGRAVGEIGVDHDPSPGQGPFYMKHYETNTWYSGYDTKKEALADLKHVVDQMNEGVGGDMAKLIGIPVVAGAAAIGAQHYDDQQPHVEIGGQNAKIVRADSSRIPGNAMTLTGKDGKTYRVWQTSGKGTNKMTLAAPVEQVKEADKKKDEPETRDVALQRAITRAKADFPTAGSGLEALAKDFMRSQDQDQKSLDQLQQAERKQDQMLQQISKIDQEQEQEIQGLEQQNSTLASRLQQLQSVNSQLEKKLAAMSGRKAEKKSKTDSAPVVATGATTEPITPVAKKATKPKAKARPAKPSNKPVAKRLTAPAPGARAFSSMTPALAAADNPQQSLFTSDYAQDTANLAFQKFKKNAQDIPFRDIQKVSPELRNLAQQELEPTTENNKQKPERPEADYGPEYQDMVSRVKKLAGQGPRKTIWDPVKRVYKTVPVNK